MKQRKSPSPKIPARWMFVLLGLAVLYILLQPIANRQFGWNLPSLGSLVSEPPVGEPQAKDQVEKSPETTREPSPRNDRPSAQQPPLPEMQSTSTAPEREKQNKVPGRELPTPKEAGDSNQKPDDEDQDELLHGVLRSLGREEYLSPAGLRYTRGSAEGHRLRHLERHLEDQPERSGRHGVFSGDMEQFLKHIDQGYLRAKQRQPQTSTRVEEGRTIYETTFDKPIGYIGGRDGARLQRPSTKKLRVVVDEDRVITAFPY